MVRTPLTIIGGPLLYIKFHNSKRQPQILVSWQPKTLMTNPTILLYGFCHLRTNSYDVTKYESFSYLCPIMMRFFFFFFYLNYLTAMTMPNQVVLYSTVWYLIGPQQMLNYDKKHHLSLMYIFQPALIVAWLYTDSLLPLSLCLLGEIFLPQKYFNSRFFITTIMLSSGRNVILKIFRYWKYLEPLICNVLIRSWQHIKNVHEDFF